MGLKDDFAETEVVPRNLSVEHVLPQGWHTHWPLPENAEPGAATRRSTMLHTIGNLTLLKQKLNSAQQNYPWNGGDGVPSKRAKLEEYSVLHLNKALSKADTWDEEAIENRASVLLKVAQETWPRPVSDKDAVQD